MTSRGRFVVSAGAVAAVVATTVLSGAGVARAEGFYAARKAELCVDIAGGKLVEGTPIMLWPCHGKAPQLFDYDPARKAVVARANRSLCVDDVVKQGLALVKCNATRMRWTVDNSAPGVRSQDGRCWDARGGALAPRTRMILWPCHGKANQQFSYF